jgi:hypothetical protein
MLNQNAILDANDVCRNPVHWLAEARNSPVHDHKILFGHNRSRFIFQRRREALYGIKQTVAAGLDMSAVLDIVGRPITLGRSIVPLVEQCVECF